MLTSPFRVVIAEPIFLVTNVYAMPSSLVILEYSQVGLQMTWTMKTMTKNCVDSNDDDGCDDDWNRFRNSVVRYYCAAVVPPIGVVRIASILAF